VFVGYCRRVGHEQRALEEIDRELEWIEKSDERCVESEFHRLRGEVLHPRDAAEAEHSFATALDIARSQGAVGGELRALLSIHRHASGAKARRARDELSQVVATCTEGLDTGDLREARSVLEA